MNKSDAITSVYQQVKMAINQKISSLGYQPVHEADNDAVYGSRHMLWSNNMEAVRFCWDGKEDLLILEITEDLPLKPMSRWEEILTKSFNPADYSLTVANQITSQFLQGLQ